MVLDCKGSFRRPYIEEQCMRKFPLTYVKVPHYTEDVDDLGNNTKEHTEEGKKYKPISDFTLCYAAENNISFDKLLGPTQSSNDLNSPFSRIKIIEELSKKEVMRESEISRLLGFSEVSHSKSHLLPLSEQGFIEFDSFNTHESEEKIYMFKGEVKDIKKKFKKFNNGRQYDVNKVESIMKEVTKNGRYFSISDMADLEIYSRKTCETIIYSLKNSGMLYSEYLGMNRSYVRPLEKLEEFNSEWIVPVKDALKNENIIKSLESEIDPIKARKVAEMWRQDSPYGRSKPVSERMKDIEKFIADNPGCRPKDISLAKNIDTATAGVYLRKLHRQRKITYRHPETSNLTKCWYSKY